MTDGVLPGLVMQEAIIGVGGSDVLVDVPQQEAPLRGVQDGLGDERHVGEARLLQLWRQAGVKVTVITGPLIFQLKAYTMVRHMSVKGQAARKVLRFDPC